MRISSPAPELQAADRSARCPRSCRSSARLALARSRARRRRRRAAASFSSPRRSKCAVRAPVLQLARELARAAPHGAAPAAARRCPRSGTRAGSGRETRRAAQAGSTNRENTSDAQRTRHADAAVGARSEQDRERAEMTRFMRWAGERHGRPFADYAELWQLVGGRARGLLGEHLGVLRRARLAAATSGCWTPARCPARAGSRARELNYAENLLAAATSATPGDGGGAARLGAARAGRAHLGRAAAQVARRGRRPARAGRRPRRPRGGLHAEHPRDAHRVPGGRQHRGDLVERRARVRGAQRDRPLRADRAEGAAGGRRLPPRRQGLRPHAPPSQSILAELPTVEHVCCCPTCARTAIATQRGLPEPAIDVGR